MTKLYIKESSLNIEDIEVFWLDDFIENLVVINNKYLSCGKRLKVKNLNQYCLEFSVYRLETNEEYQKRLDKEDKEKDKNIKLI